MSVKLPYELLFTISWSVTVLLKHSSLIFVLEEQFASLCLNRNYDLIQICSVSAGSISQTHPLNENICYFGKAISLHSYNNSSLSYVIYINVIGYFLPFDICYISNNYFRLVGLRRRSFCDYTKTFVTCADEGAYVCSCRSWLGKTSLAYIIGVAFVYLEFEFF